MGKKRYLNVLVTGSSSGMGLEIVKVFAEAGHNVLLNGPEPNGDGIAKEIGKKHRVRAAFSSADLSKPDEIMEMISFGTAHFGYIDVLVNNSNVQYDAPLENFPVEKWEMVMTTNLSSVFYGSKAVWKSMKAHSFGRIINIASIHALKASEYKAAYVSANHGLVGLTKVLSLEGAPHGITCNLICPGQVRTPEVEDAIADQAMAHNISEEQVIQKIMLKRQPIKAFATPTSVGVAALFLSSEYASAITGITMPIDGGSTIKQ